MPKSEAPVSRHIAQVLEQRIVDGTLEAALPLRQAELALEFGCSHIPVREALASLAEKGLVQISPNRGAVVVPLSADQCRELADMRVALEALAVKQSVPRMTADHLACARKALASARKAKNLQARAQGNWAFHRALYAAADRPFMMGQLERLWMHADRYLQYTWAHLPYEPRSDSEHEAILEACARRDVRLAARLTREHILAAALATVPLLEEQDKGAAQ
jgi:DNA-binding GntR family transcriptional regulator